MSNQTTPVSSADLKQAALDLVPALVERQADAEASRRLSDETIIDLVEAGLIHTQLPQHLGGQGIDTLSEMEVSANVARGCASTSWVRSVLAGTTGLFAHLGERGIEEVFGSASRLPIACGVNSLGGTATKVDGGYVVDGSWGFASGSLHADYAFLGSRIASPDEGSPRTGAACIPLSSATIKETWFVAGMAATGSNTIIVEDVFVPDHLMLGEPDGVVGMLGRSPLVPRFGVVLVGTLVGAVEGLFDRAVENVSKRGVTYFGYCNQADSEAILHGYAEVAMTIDSARLHMQRAVQDLMAEDADGPMSYLASTRGQADAAYAARLVRRAADRLMSLTGASAFGTNNPAQRTWRDVNVGCSHAMLNPTASLSLYGRALAGEPSNSPFWGPDASFLV